MHEYFNRTFSEWNIIDFLDACDLQNFSQKVGIYLKSLEDISDSNKGRRGERAKELLNRYKEERRPDYFSARKWRDNHESSDAIHGHSLHLHNPTFTKTLIGNSGSISGKTYFNLSDNASKRSHQEYEQSEQDFLKKRTKIDQLPCIPPHQIKSSGDSRAFPLETNGEIPAHDDESDNESIISDSPLHDEFVREMKMADGTKEYYSGTESVNYDDDDGYVYSSESSSCDSSDNDDTIVDDSQLGEGKSHAKDALYNLRYNLKLNNEEKECIEKLKGLLKNVDMMLDDFKLLHEVKSKSNMMFHHNNQDLKAAKLQLNDTVQDGVKIYKPPIKTLESIGK
ncbi:unnamed protein product [Rhizophagus irregularis]|uniref:Uncharacterized protein n=1 Tax=Rhizophagus irregularis TaxID=588596 RepID=A0A915YWR1_9GLOM|nr:unnamed protein product [Rhizophagus irregularis]